jgi:hypothetical protein
MISCLAQFFALVELADQCVGQDSSSPHYRSEPLFSCSFGKNFWHKAWKVFAASSFFELNTIKISAIILFAEYKYETCVGITAFPRHFVELDAQPDGTG